MSYNNEQRNEKSKQNKQKIIISAKKLILEKGYENVSVSQITKLAGVSKGAFYLHFKTKDDIISDLIDLTFKSIYEASINLPFFESLSNYLTESIKLIIKTGLKMAQTWFSSASKSSIYGKSKLHYDLENISNILMKKLKEKEAITLSKKITSIYYGILIRWCIEDGLTDPLFEIQSFIENEIKKMF